MLIIRNDDDDNSNNNDSNNDHNNMNISKHTHTHTQQHTSKKPRAEAADHAAGRTTRGLSWSSGGWEATNIGDWSCIS